MDVFYYNPTFGWTVRVYDLAFKDDEGHPTVLIDESFGESKGKALQFAKNIKEKDLV